MWRREALTLISAAVLTATLCSGTAAAAPCPAADARPGEATPQVLGGAVLCLVNQVRAAHGAPPVRLHPDLTAIAVSHAWDMQAGDYFAHRSPDGRSLGDRLTTTSYLDRVDEFRVGENLGWGVRSQSTPRATVWRWMLSRGHRENMLNPVFEDAGVAASLGAPKPGLPDEQGAAYALVLGMHRAAPARRRSGLRKAAAKRKQRGRCASKRRCAPRPVAG